MVKLMLTDDEGDDDMVDVDVVVERLPPTFPKICRR